MRTELLTRIRRGDVSIADYSKGGRIASPVFWGDGSFSVKDHGMLWLSANELAQLQQSGRTGWNPEFHENIDNELADELETVIETRKRATAGNTAVTLEMISDRASYIVPVNGEMSALPALQVRDSIGLAEVLVPQ